MYAINIKFGNGRLITFLLAVIIVVTLLVFLRLNKVDSGVEGQSTCTDSSSVVDYLGSFGIIVDADSVIEDEVHIPVDFNEIYSDYNKIQKQQGFDLTKYKDKTLKRYTYQVLNYDDGRLDVFAEVLIDNNVVVGADVYCTNANGFIKALK